jgi:hypothetical protein
VYLLGGGALCATTVIAWQEEPTLAAVAAAEAWLKEL